MNDPIAPYREEFLRLQEQAERHPRVDHYHLNLEPDAIPFVLTCCSHDVWKFTPEELFEANEDASRAVYAVYRAAKALQIALSYPDPHEGARHALYWLTAN